MLEFNHLFVLFLIFSFPICETKKGGRGGSSAARNGGFFFVGAGRFAIFL